MKVRDLKRRLKELEGLSNDVDEMEVVLSGHDHSYMKASGAFARPAEKFEDGHLSEYYGASSKSDPNSPVVDVLLIA